MKEKIETVIVGGGQAGLAISYELKKRGKENLVLEKSALAGEAWRNHRWDSFSLVSPNWTFLLPGAEYNGDNPDGFMLRAEVVDRLERYVRENDLPVWYNTSVSSVEALDGKGYIAHTNSSQIQANNVVIATGLFQQAKIPAFAQHLPSGLLQMHTSEYRNPDSLPKGSVLIVGSGQSGCQIAEELHKSGFEVFLSVGSAERLPRRYRGKDIFYWAHRTGLLDTTPDKLSKPAARFLANPHLTGEGGGRTLNLHEFFRNGIHLVGRLKGKQDGKFIIAPDLKENLANADKAEVEFVQLVDKYIQENGLDAPEEEIPQLADAYEASEINSLSINENDITTVIWACGYTFDFSLTKLPILDEYGYPVSQRGVVEQHPGLFFLGLPWLSKMKSGLFMGIKEDAEYIAEKISE